MAAHLRLVVENDPTALALTRQRAAEAIVGKASSPTAVSRAPPGSSKGAIQSEPAPVAPTESFVHVDLALTAAALALVPPSQHSHAEEAAPFLAQLHSSDGAEASTRSPSDGAESRATAQIGLAAVDGSNANVHAGGDGAANATREVPGSRDLPPTSGPNATAEPNSDELPRGAEATATKHVGSSTAIDLITGSNAADDSGPSRSEAPSGGEAFEHADGDGLLSGPISGAETFFVSSPAPGNPPQVIIGEGEDDIVDFSSLVALEPASPISIVRASGSGATQAEEIRQVGAGNGVYVDLSAMASSDPTSIQAWQLDANGLAATALAHIEGVDDVVGTIGNDIVVGNANANTFIYSARSDVVTDAAGNTGLGPAASYGFDIYVGGDADPADGGDAVDFSRLGAAGANGEIALPFAAVGISVDLEQSATVSVTDPVSGAELELRGSLVSTTGGAERVDLALLVWSGSAEDSAAGGASSTIETVVGTRGADIVSGDGQANTYVMVGDGSAGPSTFDGRGGEDTIDFSRLDTDEGVEIDLGSLGSDGVAVATTGSGQQALVELSNVENVIGTDHDDRIDGDENDNFVFGGEGSDTFIFADWVLDGGVMRLDIGHDTIADFEAGLGGDGDKLVLSNVMFDFDGDLTDFKKILKVLEHAHEDEGGLVIDIDANNSIRLENVHFEDVRVVEDGTISLTLQFQDAFLFI
ncbi:MAG: hypothetical protein AB1749_15420 [Pseudomonadota bacterium]